MTKVMGEGLLRLVGGGLAAVVLIAWWGRPLYEAKASCSTIYYFRMHPDVVEAQAGVDLGTACAECRGVPCELASITGGRTLDALYGCTDEPTELYLYLEPQ